MSNRVVVLATVVGWLASTYAQGTDAFQEIMPVTDPAMKKSLNGEWRLKVIDGISEEPTVPDVDNSWGSIPVPACWETYGFCKPKYDSPNALTGYYRTTFTVPTAWQGLRIVLRFDGVLYGYNLWVNGKQAGPGDRRIIRHCSTSLTI